VAGIAKIFSGEKEVETILGVIDRGSRRMVNDETMVQSEDQYITAWEAHN
jgi:hypothetical protein